MKRIAFSVVLACFSISLVSCGSYSRSSATTGSRSGLKFRVFLANALAPTGLGSNLPVIDIIDANRDLVAATVPLGGTVTNPQIMMLTPNRQDTLVYGATNPTLTLVNNASESLNTPGSGASSTTSLTGATQITLPADVTSIVIAPAGVDAFAAAPNANVPGQLPGAVIVADLVQGKVVATIPVPGARYLLQSPDGNHILVFSDNSDSVTEIAPVLIGTGNDPRTVVTGFDRPVGGIFTSNSNALIFNCGPECGGAAAGIASFNLSAPPTSTLPVPAATVGLLSGNNLYVAGSAPNMACTSGTQATACGTVTAVNVSTMTVTNSAEITNGYHTLMSMGPDGQLFIGSTGCNNITAQNNGSSGEIRGCLSILDTQKFSVVNPPDNGDVTGIQPITGRTVVYVCENGSLRIYDTTTDKLAATQISLAGDMTNVLLVDTPQ